MNRFVLASLAEQDLTEIVTYVAEHSSPDRAAAVVGEIFAAADRLAEMPRIGHAREDLTNEPVLFWSVYSYLIVYRPETSPLEIVRVISGWRDVEVALLPG